MQLFDLGDKIKIRRNDTGSEIYSCFYEIMLRLKAGNYGPGLNITILKSDITYFLTEIAFGRFEDLMISQNSREFFKEFVSLLRDAESEYIKSL